jgi:hypothetical protein
MVCPHHPLGLERFQMKIIVHRISTYETMIHA